MPAKKAKKVNKSAKKQVIKYSYDFGKKTDGSSKLRELLGGKGANLAEMARIGLPVPPGFTLTTEVCTYFYDNKRTYPKSLEKEVITSVATIEKELGKKLGAAKNPLLLSVRSGARESMPGMMDTILNLGLNDKTVKALANESGNEAFAYDCYRRFIQMYGDVVMGVQARSENEHCPFEETLEKLRKEAGVELDNQLTAADLKELIQRYKAVIKKRTGKSFPQDAYAQLWGSVGAVFKSWQNERATLYRQKYGIPAAWGTAVNVQAMVFGNMGDDCATGVAFTRDPANGEKVFYGEYLINAQGEDVVAGIRTPNPIAQLKDEMPQAYDDLEAVRKKLEKHFKDMQDFEFTVENGQLYMLQTRNGKRTGLAAVRIAVELNKERLIDQKTALLKIPADSISSLLVAVFDPVAEMKAKTLATGLPAGPGAASGKVCFTADKAEAVAAAGGRAILCRVETTPEDLRGMIAADGILTSRGGVSSHAALVARQMNKVCVCGASDVIINYGAGTLKVSGKVLKEGDDISINGTTGDVYAGSVSTAPSEVNQVLNGQLKPSKSYTYQMYEQVMTWADKFRKMGVRTNADSPDQSKAAVAYGAEGIGLCRTEHMFFEGDRITFMRQMILATDEKERRAALKKLLPFQRKDFTGLFKAMGGRPVTVRLLDPPLHEFLPHDDSSKRDLANSLGVDIDVISNRVHALHEANPMLGHRGCRLGISYPEITEMQSRAIFEAAAACYKLKNPVKVVPEVMIPLVGFADELKNQVAVVHRVAKEVMAAKKVKFKYLVGTMIEVPRGALTADEIAETAEFFSFGTNDLTQTGLGMSRDDAGSFLAKYKELDILPQNPFASIDAGGVGQLVEIGADKGRAARKGLKLGICGEHGGDPASIKFFHSVGLNYVSCSPPRVPVARLAAAQAAIQG
ncbi:MAG: pyruvate, phosphate dikinase [Puniceicoccaceae bacterium MED-G31]|nr:pyruvate, phosphate dikinase [Coraliomargarita sp.]PDH28741.1 MAG: pyruvate, phosphate dikinase [Puniceicoccaceae bacterium MED-G31]|tara:strand:+ start:3649 stop:6390 length:2742 start_codon:yes stop_codon:yes gene_type:complete